MMENRLGLPCVGVVSFLHDLGLDEEDGVALDDRASAARQWRNLESGPTRALRIGIIALPHMANFTDFDALAHEPAVSMAFVQHPDEMAAADLLILPGTKQTLDDLNWLEKRGFVGQLRRLQERGVPVIGICGGFQMLGICIEDPQGIENNGRPLSQAGLGILPMRTVLRSEKTVRRIRGSLRGGFFGAPSAAQANFEGYEIHVGETFYEIGARPLADILRHNSMEAVPDGAVSDSGRVFGTYVHGFFDHDDFRHELIQAARAAVDLAPAAAWTDVSAEREARIDRLAGHLRQSLNLDLLKSWIVAPGAQELLTHSG
jgi:adenosylcobyric acid synthase